MDQYFELGEEVLLRSKDNPKMNCDSIITKVYIKGDRYTDSKGVVFEKHSGMPCYRLAIDDVRNVPFTTAWKQSALRKKHDPGQDQDFNSLIADLNKDKVNEH